MVGNVHSVRYYAVRLRRSERLPYVLARRGIGSAVVLLALVLIVLRV